MRIHQIIFLGFIAAVFVAGCIKAPIKMLGAVIGGILGVAIPFLLSQLYVWRGGDPTAAGAFPFFCFIALPLGIGIGVLVASWVAGGKR